MNRVNQRFVYFIKVLFNCMLSFQVDIILQNTGYESKKNLKFVETLKLKKQA